MRIESVTVLGGGWSVKDVDLDRLPGTVIGINDSAVLARCDIALSMDRLWAEHRWQQVKSLGRKLHLRRAAAKNVPAWDGLEIFDCDHTRSEFSAEAGTLHGTNSGACGFNLAYQMRPEAIYLVGFDMGRSPTGETYWFPPYYWAAPQGGTGNARYAEWSKQFGVVADQCRAAMIDVFIVAPRAGKPGIREFKAITPDELARRAV
jgi:hypothetical protein